MRPDNIMLAIHEVMAEINASSKPANEVLNAYTRARRYIGSSDRRAITSAVWANLRARPWPKWLEDVFPADEKEAIKTEAQTILRANGDRAEICAALAEEGMEAEPTKLSPIGLVLTKRGPLGKFQTFHAGKIEVQDEGSQLAALATGIKAGESVLDYCAGAGGKSLCFAQMMNNEGHIVAHDISALSLAELRSRAERAGVKMIETTFKPQGEFDHVVVDAPCSGSGTWRRCPDAPLRLTEEMWKNVQKKQASILDEACTFVKKGGLLHYMTCSLLESENQGQMNAFCKRHPDFKLIHHEQWTPAKHGTDGFFLATFKRV